MPKQPAVLQYKSLEEMRIVTMQKVQVGIIPLELTIKLKLSSAGSKIKLLYQRGRTTKKLGLKSSYFKGNQMFNSTGEKNNLL